MTLLTSLSLLTTMLLLAALPGPGMLLVIARTLDNGWKQGLVTVAGIMTADYIFICLAVYGLATLAGVMGSLFIFVKYVGAAYLIWLGIKLTLSQKSTHIEVPKKASLHSANYLAGLLTTLGNPKAILFFLSFFPAFLDLTQVSLVDVATIFLIEILSVGSVMTAYVFLAVKAQSSLKSSSKTKYLKYGSGAFLIGGGVFVALRN
jgi:threonine/homoserine/homoserine lactone efflux protein